MAASNELAVVHSKQGVGRGEELRMEDDLQWCREWNGGWVKVRSGGVGWGVGEGVGMFGGGTEKDLGLTGINTPAWEE